MRKREVWLDALRILSAFLVIVNHTNTAYQMVNPSQGTWWVSIAWYVVCKIAVPIYVMVSGACLLGREDSYRKCFGRFLRITGALLLFSYLHFLHESWVNGVLWPQMLRLDIFLAKIQAQTINGAYWYLYFYAALMLMLPLLQRLSCAMSSRDLNYLIGMCFGFGMLWPMIGQLFPQLARPTYFDPSLFSALLGLFFLGWKIRQKPVPTSRQTLLCSLLFIGCTLISLLLLYSQFEESAKYWRFMDDRTQPSPLVACCAVCTMLIFRRLFQKTQSDRAVRLWNELGQCSFGIYLVHHWLINETQYSLYYPLWSYMPAFFAGIVWEIVIFCISLAIAFVMRRIPKLKQLV